jgi:hypothetical protein
VGGYDGRAGGSLADCVMASLEFGWVAGTAALASPASAGSCGWVSGRAGAVRALGAAAGARGRPAARRLCRPSLAPSAPTTAAPICARPQAVPPLHRLPLPLLPWLRQGRRQLRGSKLWQRRLVPVGCACACLPQSAHWWPTRSARQHAPAQQDCPPAAKRAEARAHIPCTHRPIHSSSPSPSTQACRPVTTPGTRSPGWPGAAQRRCSTSARCPTRQRARPRPRRRRHLSRLRRSRRRRRGRRRSRRRTS